MSCVPPERLQQNIRPKPIPPRGKRSSTKRRETRTPAGESSSAAGPGCYHCHMIEGRGRSIGPDLTMIGHSQTREHVLESILQPSKEIAPLFTLWTITTKSGQRIDGMLLRRDGQETEVYVDASGQETKVNEKDVIDRKMRSESLMPSGLVAGLSDQELRDVLAFLMQKR